MNEDDVTGFQVYYDSDRVPRIRFVPGLPVGPPAIHMVSAVGDDLDASVACLLENGAGMRWASVDPRLIDALKSRGATSHRVFAFLQCDLTTWHPPVLSDFPDIQLVQLTPALAHDAATVEFAAFPPDGLDPMGDTFEDVYREEIAWLNQPDMPLLPASTLAYSDGAPVGLCMINEVSDMPGFEGPFLSVLARVPRPEVKGLGEWQLATAMAELVRDRWSRISLSVTRPNPARGLYERLGFVEVMPAETLSLPSETDPTT